MLIILVMCGRRFFDINFIVFFNFAQYTFLINLVIVKLDDTPTGAVPTSV